MRFRIGVSSPRAEGEPPGSQVLSPERWGGKAALLLLSIALFTFAFAPFKQFYLAWFALVPWLIVLRHCRSALTALLWSWLGGVGFFVANMWWLAYVTGPGMLALMLLLGLYWGVAGAIIRGTGLLGIARSLKTGEAVPARGGIMSVALIAAVWVGLEWFRAVWPLGGLPWLYLGHTQSPVLHLCQIADITGVYGISFWVMLVNAWLAMLLLSGRSARRLVPSGIMVAAVTAAIVGYGSFRFSQQTTAPGPTVLVVQPNYPQSNSGDKGASESEIAGFHLRITRDALEKRPGVNLVVWSETMMPALNPGARDFFRGTRLGRFWEDIDHRISALARADHVAILAGGVYHDQWVERPDGIIPLDRRNAAYFYSLSGALAGRYDKIHLVPFGEYLPFKLTIPPLYRLFLSLSPYTEEYTLTPGPSDALTVFELKSGWRFVAPICFEDIDPALVRRMFKPGPGSPSVKRADFLVNVTNDGWFKYNEMPQHLQAAIFRSIENRAATARSVNTGISGFIDSLGRTSGLLPVDHEGVSVATLSLDKRISIYTRVGDVFAFVCAAITGLLVVMSVFRWWRLWRQ